MTEEKSSQQLFTFGVSVHSESFKTTDSGPLQEDTVIISWASEIEEEERLLLGEGKHLDDELWQHTQTLSLSRLPADAERCKRNARRPRSQINHKIHRNHTKQRTQREKNQRLAELQAHLERREKEQRILELQKQQEQKEKERQERRQQGKKKWKTSSFLAVLFLHN